MFWVSGSLVQIAFAILRMYKMNRNTIVNFTKEECLSLVEETSESFGELKINHINLIENIVGFFKDV